MKILHFPRRTHSERVKVNLLATGSVNIPGPLPSAEDLRWELWNEKLELLRKIDQQLEVFGLEAVVLENGPDALIWRIDRSQERVEKVVTGFAAKQEQSADAEALRKELGLETSIKLEVDEEQKVVKAAQLLGEETSPRIASLAAAILNMDDDDIRKGVNTSNDFIRNIKSIAASALSQKQPEEEDAI